MHKQAHQAIGDAAGGRDGQDPGPDDALDHRELQGPWIFGEADSHDRGRNAVRGRHRHAEVRGDGQDGRGTGFRPVVWTSPCISIC